MIRAEIIKIEASNDFLDCVSFGGPVMKSGDPIEQGKQLKYASLVANTIMLSNVADLSHVLSDMASIATRSRQSWSPQPAPTTADTFCASDSTRSTWSTCQTHSTHSRSPSSRTCDCCVHVSRTYPKHVRLVLRIAGSWAPARWRPRRRRSRSAISWSEREASSRDSPA